MKVCCCFFVNDSSEEKQFFFFLLPVFDFKILLMHTRYSIIPGINFCPLAILFNIPLFLTSKPLSLCFSICIRLCILKNRAYLPISYPVSFSDDWIRVISSLCNNKQYNITWSLPNFRINWDGNVSRCTWRRRMKSFRERSDLKFQSWDAFHVSSTMHKICHTFIKY